MMDEMSPEREEYLIEQAAQYVVNHDLEDFLQIILEGTLPYGDIVGELGFLASYPLAVTFFSRAGADFINMFGFNYIKNTKRLLERVEELKEMKERQRMQLKELERREGNREGWFKRQISRLRRLI
jgi:hypothetical protein